MTKDITLDVNVREKSKPAESGSLVPGILYGRGIENVMVWVDRKKFNKLYDELGESTVFKLALDGSDERNVLVKDVQHNILDGETRHVDFYQVRMDEEIEAEVELVFEGESPAVKELGGILVKNIDAIQVKCLPGNLPPEVKVDISALKTFEDYIYVKDLPISDKVEVLVEPDTVVAMVSEPRTEEDLAELETEVKEDVTKVEGVVKEETSAEGDEKKEKE
ncbi:MAG: 50S ribosomal protein L25 [Candidatus Moranbacteria bacterium]|nr:50S ribosomal protein L25 [Candidatus Moranbacteria bacterium]